MIKVFNEENFENEVLNSDKTTIVDFYADWCGPCRMLGPILEELEGIDILKVNVDTFHEISNKYGVMSIPTLILFNNGQEVSKSIGLRSKEEIEKMLK